MIYCIYFITGRNLNESGEFPLASFFSIISFPFNVTWGNENYPNFRTKIYQTRAREREVCSRDKWTRSPFGRLRKNNFSIIRLQPQRGLAGRRASPHGFFRRLFVTRERTLFWNENGLMYAKRVGRTSGRLCSAQRTHAKWKPRINYQTVC